MRGEGNSVDGWRLRTAVKLMRVRDMNWPEKRADVSTALNEISLGCYGLELHPNIPRLII